MSSLSGLSNSDAEGFCLKLTLLLGAGAGLFAELSLLLRLLLLA